MWNLSSFHLETMLVSVQDWNMVCARCPRGLKSHFGHTWWYHYVTRLKWKLVCVLSEIVLIFTHDRCLVCVEGTIGLEIVLDTHDGTPRWHGDKNPLGFDGWSFNEWLWWTRLVEKHDVHGLTTTIQGRYALATDTPPPMVVVILRRDNQPLGHSSCNQSKNSQEQVLNY
jgi:hypothetical protein